MIIFNETSLIMNKVKLLVVSILLFSFSSNAQTGEGNYHYANDEIILTFVTIDGGWGLSDVVLTHTKTGKSASGVGEWFKLNMNGVDPDYKGPEGWYQFELNECYYEFNEPTETLILVEGCGKAESKKYILTLSK